MRISAPERLRLIVIPSIIWPPRGCTRHRKLNVVPQIAPSFHYGTLVPDCTIPGYSNKLDLDNMVLLTKDIIRRSTRRLQIGISYYKTMSYAYVLCNPEME